MVQPHPMKNSAKLIRCNCIAMLIILAAVTAVSADQTPNLINIGAYDLMDEVRRVAIDGDYAYIGSEHDVNGEGWGGLWVVDISDRANPQYVTHLLLTDVEDVAISGDYAFVADGIGERLVVLNIADPYNPFEVTALEIGSTTWRVEIVGTLAYVTARSSGLLVFDISDPTNPVTLGQAGYAYASSLSLLWDYAYGHNALEQFRILNIADPTDPYVVSTLDTEYYVNDIAARFLMPAEEKVAFLAAGTSGLRIIDVLSETNPTEILHVDPGSSVLGIDVVQTPDFTETEAFLATESGLKIYDFSTLLTPVLKADYPTSAGWVPQAMGNELFLSQRHNGLEIIDITDTSNPLHVGEFKTGTNVRCLSVNGDYTYTGTEIGGVWIMDTSDLSNPVAISRFPSMSSAHYCELVGNLFYVVGTLNGIQGLYVYDVTVPDAPVFLGGSERNRYYNFIVEGTTVWASQYSGLYVLDFSDPANVVEVGSWLDVWEGAYGLCKNGNYIYFADGYYMEILDVSDPANPNMVLRYEAAEGWMGGAIIEGNYAYLPGDGDLRIMDITNPIAPTEVSFTGGFGDGYEYDLHLEGGLLYMATSRGGLQIANVSDPLNPVSYANFEIDNGDAHCLEVLGDLIYLANETSFLVFNLESTTPVEPDMGPFAGHALLEQNSPNPFNPSTNLSFELAAPSHARLTIYDTAGRVVAVLLDEHRVAGRHTVAWNGTDAGGNPVASGIYLYQIEAGAYAETKRMTLVK